MLDLTEQINVGVSPLIVLSFHSIVSQQYGGARKDLLFEFYLK